MRITHWLALWQRVDTSLTTISRRYHSPPLHGHKWPPAEVERLSWPRQLTPFGPRQDPRQELYWQRQRSR